MTNRDDEIAKNIWTLRNQGLDDFEAGRLDWSRPVKESDLIYLLEHYPYLEIAATSMSGGVYRFNETLRYRADSGWKIQYDGIHMSSSAGIRLYGNGDPDDEDGGGQQGTIINQAVTTAYSMLALAKGFDWYSFEILSGSSLMKWAAWMAAEDYDITLENYAPTEDDFLKRRRVREHLSSYKKSSFSASFRRGR